MFIRFLCAFVSTILFSVSPAFSQSSGEPQGYGLRPAQESSTRARDFSNARAARVFELTREADKKIKAATDTVPGVRTANRTSENRYDDAIDALNLAEDNRGGARFEGLRERAQRDVAVARGATGNAKTTRQTAQYARDAAQAARDHAASVRIVARRARETAKATRAVARREREADRETRERARADRRDGGETQADRLWEEADKAWDGADWARDYADDLRDKADDARDAADKARIADDKAREDADGARVTVDQKIEAAFNAMEAAAVAQAAAVEAFRQFQQTQPGTQAHVDAKERAEGLVAEARTLTQTSDKADKTADAAIEAIKELDGAAIKTKRAAESAEQIAGNKEHTARQKEKAAEKLEEAAIEKERAAMGAGGGEVGALDEIPVEDLTPLYMNPDVEAHLALMELHRSQGEVYLKAMDAEYDSYSEKEAVITALIEAQAAEGQRLLDSYEPKKQRHKELVETLNKRLEEQRAAELDRRGKEKARIREDAAEKAKELAKRIKKGEAMPPEVESILFNTDRDGLNEDVFRLREEWYAAQEELRLKQPRTIAEYRAQARQMAQMNADYERKIRELEYEYDNQLVMKEEFMRPFRVSGPPPALSGSPTPPSGPPPAGVMPPPIPGITYPPPGAPPATAQGTAAAEKETLADDEAMEAYWKDKKKLEEVRDAELNNLNLKFADKQYQIRTSHASQADKDAVLDALDKDFKTREKGILDAFNREDNMLWNAHVANTSKEAAGVSRTVKRESKTSKDLQADFKQRHPGTGGGQAGESTGTEDPLKEISPEDAEIIRKGMEDIVKSAERVMDPGWKPKGMMPHVPDDEWDFLPEYKPGESIYEGLEEGGSQTPAGGAATGGQTEAQPTGDSPRKPADLRPSQGGTGMPSPAESTSQGQSYAGTGTGSVPLEKRLKKESKHSKQLMEDIKRKYYGESGELIGPTVTEHPDGRITTEYSGGGTATKLLDGTSEFVMPQPKGQISITRLPDSTASTTTSTLLDNGTIAFTTQNPDGTYMLELYDSDGTYTKTVTNEGGDTTTRTTHPDGRVKEIRPGIPDVGPGTTVIPNPDRGFTIVTENQDGSETSTTMSGDGTRSMTTWPDGKTSITTGTLRDDGTETFTSTNPDGTRTVEVFGSDGSYTVDVPNPDGTRTIDRTAPNGARTRKTVDQNGKTVALETMKSDGTWTSSTPDPQRGFTDSSQAAGAGTTPGRTSPVSSGAVSGATSGSASGDGQSSARTPPLDGPSDPSKTRDRDPGKTEGSGSPGASTSVPWTRRGPNPVTTVPR